MQEENVKPESMPFVVTDSLVLLLLTVRHRRSMKKLKLAFNEVIFDAKCFHIIAVSVMVIF